MAPDRCNQNHCKILNSKGFSKLKFRFFEFFVGSKQRIKKFCPIWKLPAVSITICDGHSIYSKSWCTSHNNKTFFLSSDRNRQRKKQRFPKKTKKTFSFFQKKKKNSSRKVKKQKIVSNSRNNRNKKQFTCDLSHTAVFPSCSCFYIKSSIGL